MSEQETITKLEQLINNAFQQALFNVATSANDPTLSPVKNILRVYGLGQAYFTLKAAQLGIPTALKKEAVVVDVLDLIEKVFQCINDIAAPKQKQLLDQIVIAFQRVVKTYNLTIGGDTHEKGN